MRQEAQQFYVRGVLETVYETVVTADTQDQAEVVFRSRFERNEIRGRRVGLRGVVSRRLNTINQYDDHAKE